MWKDDEGLSLAYLQKLEQLAGVHNAGRLVGHFKMPSVLGDDVVGFGGQGAFVDAVILLMLGDFERPPVLTLAAVLLEELAQNGAPRATFD